MDNIRLILILAVAFLSMMIWQQWQQDYGPKSTEEASYAFGEIKQSVSETKSTDLPAPPVSATNDQKSSELPVTADNKESAITNNDVQSARINVVTDTLSLVIDSKGGAIVKANLRKYPLSLERPDTEFPLLTELPSNFYIAQSGLISADKKMAPTHESVFTSSASEYALSEGKDKLVVNLNWQNDEGVQVIKKYEFTRGSYLIKISYDIINNSSTNWIGRQYQQLQRARPSDDGGNAFIYTYTGGAIYSEAEKYEKIDFDEMDDAVLSRDIKGGWQAMLQHYFVSAWIPPADQIHHFYSKALSNGRYILGSYSPNMTVAAGQTGNMHNQFFTGPKLQHELKEISKGLDLVVDYGFLSILAQPIYWVLEQIYALVNNWGWSIILLTILIKAVFFKLSEASYKSMANMRKVAPRLQTLKERYGDDKQRLNQAMMEMYKKEKINPLGGCLPMLVQIPVFIALYWVLLESVELRQAPWILWIKDLSIMDPYYILPLLMGITMFIQQKLNPPPPDPMQAKIMMSLPIVFTVFFAFFPSGLVLYWFVNNLLSISQQWVITRRIEKAD